MTEEKMTIAANEVGVINAADLLDEKRDVNYHPMPKGKYSVGQEVVHDKKIVKILDHTDEGYLVEVVQKVFVKEEDLSAQ